MVFVIINFPSWKYKKKFVMDYRNKIIKPEKYMLRITNYDTVLRIIKNDHMKHLWDLVDKL